MQFGELEEKVGLRVSVNRLEVMELQTLNPGTVHIQCSILGMMVFWRIDMEKNKGEEMKGRNKLSMGSKCFERRK